MKTVHFGVFEILEYDLIAGESTKSLSVKVQSNSTKHKETNVEEARRLGFIVTDVLGDGNCFFRAVVDQLYKLEKYSSHQELRAIAIRHIINNPGLYIDLFTVEETMEQYIDRMETRGEYVDGIIIQALSNALRINIRIYGVNNWNHIITPHDNNAGETINLLLTAEENLEHYLSITKVVASVPQDTFLNENTTYYAPSAEVDHVMKTLLEEYEDSRGVKNTGEDSTCCIIS